jgi:hypothetical protein
MLRRPDSRAAARMSRRAYHGYWRARALASAGRETEALEVAKRTYSELALGDRDATFTETAALVMLMDKLSEQIGRPDSVRAELEDALIALRRVHADPERRSRELQRVLEWLTYRVEGPGNE